METNFSDGNIWQEYSLVSVFRNLMVMKQTQQGEGPLTLYVQIYLSLGEEQRLLGLELKK